MATTKLCKTPVCRTHTEYSRNIRNALFRAVRDPNDPFHFRFEDLSGGAVGWDWDLGDDTPHQYTKHVLDHNYPPEDEDGYFLVTLIVTFPNGDTIEYSHLVSVIPIDPSFSVEVYGQRAEFQANHTDNEVAYFWDFGDGQTGTGQAPSHTYRERPWDHQYKVKLDVVDLAGNKGHYELDVWIRTTPEQAATPLRIWEDGAQADWEDSANRLWEQEFEPSPSPGGSLYYETLTGEEFETLVGGTYEALEGAP